ncbi:MAG: FAD-binding domain-containing protein [Myxococcota bacterium]
MSPVPQVVWFKRDLRLADHEPLVQAAGRGPVVGLYIYEPAVLRGEGWDPRHFAFVAQCLEELAAGMRARGGRFAFRVGEAPQIFDQLLRELGAFELWSHEETGDLMTWARDKAVKRLCRARGIPWKELPPAGVFRSNPHRAGWAARMAHPPLAPPGGLSSVQVDEEGPRTLADLGLPTCTIDVQRGGEGAARQTLRSFLDERGEHYRRSMSSPLHGEEACSRLSPHLAYGTLSTRTVHHRVLQELARRRHQPGIEGARFREALISFSSRLRWRCHFMQKLEDEPGLEQHNANRALDGMRPMEVTTSLQQHKLAAWQDGRTGVPFVDACMRSLAATGWLNFRMRAMLVSFATHHLWLPWRPVALHLARLFVDYEPGIHFPQVQMQAGCTANNTLRVYNPVKQGREQDPEATFLRRWVPELAGLDAADAFAPWESPLTVASAGLRLDIDYPAPILDVQAAARAARDRIAAAHKQPLAREAAQLVQQRHGSRRRGWRR